ncbi:MAG: selenocysteine-specific translation elongation factor [Chloroflexales bacterium]|nr:selenocysteine-specific translation elongation factor [Chloroflexales bacterium]
MYVIGTAGHVDHGKSTLVRVLTGIDPDRWEEEKRREMTIDLGFAWLTLPSGRNVSIVDVPGHERFIKNMLAGVGGLDAALLIVAADESVMPQTEEHLAILDLLGVEHGLVVLTKADLVEAEWLDLVTDEISERLVGTSFAAAPLVAVSARTGQGLERLLTTLDDVLDHTPSRMTAQGATRLSVDRSFTVGGFGAVVTGTLLDGALAVGQEVEILPQKLRARVRGLQTHQQREERALPGTRVAVNLAGVHHSQIKRGDLLTLPGVLEPTSRVDVQVRVVPNIAYTLEQNAALDLFVGAAEVRCRATLLDREVLGPGETGWVQLRLDHMVAVARGDRCILRQPSPSLTVSGGMIVDTHPPRHRRFRPEVVSALEVLASGSPSELLLQTLGDGPPRPWTEVLRVAGLSEAMAREALADLGDEQRVLKLSDGVVVSTSGWQRLETRLVTMLQAYHKRFPLRTGVVREELRQRLNLDPRVLGAALDWSVAQGLIQINETSVWLVTHTPTLTPEQQRRLDTLLAAMQKTPYSPPTPDLEPEVLAWALERNVLIKVSDDICFLPSAYATLLTWVQSTLDGDGNVSVAQFRDQFDSSRKYALAFLEHLDERKITRRSGDVRVAY